MSYFMLKARDPFSSFSHFFGAFLSLIGMFFLIFKVSTAPSFHISHLVASIVFCLSLLALYNASGIYHFVKVSPTALQRFRKLDHAMIYVLIAGTYTPALLGCLPANHAFWLTIAIWVLAAIGIIIKMFWLNAPRWLSTAMYIAMGWFIIIDIQNLILTPLAAFLLIAGGISYTIGGIIYAIKKPNITATFGFHEIFHLFVLLGSILHYFFVYVTIV